MKQLIIMAASIMLGLTLFNLIAGSSDDSVYNLVKGVWQSEITMRTMEDGQ